MRLNKSAAIKTINQSKSITATRVSPDELSQDRTKKVKEIQQEIEKRVRQNKDLTIVIVEQEQEQKKEVTMSIDITDIIKSEIEKEQTFLSQLNQIDELDDLSKQEIRCRSYETYRHLQRQLELELSQENDPYAKRKPIVTILLENG